MSDLHSEFYMRSAGNFLSSLRRAKGADVLVLAGDALGCIDGPQARIDAFVDGARRLTDTWPHVVFVAGNHEYYGSAWTNTTLAIEAAAEARSTFHALDLTNEVTINGQRFIGGTLWFDKKSDTQPFDEQCMNDFRVIFNFTAHVYEANTTTDRWLRLNAESDDVVVTHHLPSWRSVHPKYAASRLNRFFVHDMEDLIVERQPRLWVHGHTHENCDYWIGETRVVANPRGYKHEINPRFSPGLVIEV